MQGQSMRFVGLVGILFAVMAGTAQAHPRHHSRARRAGGFTVVAADRAAVQAITHKRPRQPDAPVSRLAPRACPAGIPTQTVTLIDQTGAKPQNLARVENAVVVQSLQLRAAWGTPCVQFGAGGWELYLKIGSPDYPGGVHYGGPTSMTVWTGGGTWEAWSVPLSHEVVEALVNPTTALSVFHNEEGVGVEVADPVETEAYRLDGVFVADFVLPSWFAGGMQSARCGGDLGPNACQYTDPLLGSDAGAPYDYMRVLSAPWQLAAGVDPANVA